MAIINLFISNKILCVVTSRSFSLFFEYKSPRIGTTLKQNSSKDDHLLPALGHIFPLSMNSYLLKSFIAWGQFTIYRLIFVY